MLSKNGNRLRRFERLLDALSVTRCYRRVLRARAQRVDSLKALDPNRPIREADIMHRL